MMQEMPPLHYGRASHATMTISRTVSLARSRFCQMAGRLRWLGAFLLLLAGFAPAQGQEYLYEIGGELGVGSYTGDAVRRVAPAPLGLALGVTARYNINFRGVLTTSLTYRGLRGSTSYADNIFPAGQEASFSTSMVALSVGGEFHWRPLSDKYRYLGTTSLSPYLGGGVSLLGAWGSASSVITPGVYAAMGVKYKLTSRLTATAELRWTYSLTDRLDALSSGSAFLANPYGVNASSLRGKDSFGGIGIGLSYHFGLRNKSDC